MCQVLCDIRAAQAHMVHRKVPIPHDICVTATPTFQHEVWPQPIALTILVNIVPPTSGGNSISKSCSHQY